MNNVEGENAVIAICRWYSKMFIWLLWILWLILS